MQQRDIAIADGAVVGTVVTPSAPGGGGLLFVHGLGSDRRTNIERAQAVGHAHGVTSLAIDLRGHGASAGRLSEVTPEQNLADVLAGYDALTAQPMVDRTRIALCGASYGGYLSVLATAHRPVARLVLRAPAVYADGEAGEILSHRRLGTPATAPAFVATLAATTMPVLLVESERDEVIAHSVIEIYLAARPDIEHVVLPEAAHALTDPAWRGAYQQLLVDYVAGMA